MCGYFKEEVTCQSTLEVTGLMGNDTYKSPVYSRIFKNEMLRSPWLGPLFGKQFTLREDKIFH